MKTKKTLASRFATTILAAFMMLIISSFCTVTASAAEVETVAAPAAAVLELDTETAASPVIAPVIAPVAAAAPIAPTIIAAAAGGAAGSSSGSSSADASYTSVVTFFVTWIRRIGALVAFVGAVMFALAIKNNDADQKQNGLLTMVAGFVVIAITTAINMFDLFT